MEHCCEGQDPSRVFGLEVRRRIEKDILMGRNRLNALQAYESLLDGIEQTFGGGLV